MLRFILFILLILLVNGCSFLSSEPATYEPQHKNEMSYWLNKASLEQANGDYKESIKSFEKAYEILDEYENRASFSLRNMGSSFVSTIFSKGLEGYYGMGYERSLMHTLNSINYLMLGDFNAAAVEMRRMELRQEFWLEESSKILQKAAEDRKKIEKSGTNVSYLPDGYSMRDILQDPSIRLLANNYQDPFSYALSSIIYNIAYDDEALIDTNLKRAIALNPSSKNIFYPPRDYTKKPTKNKIVTVIALGGNAPKLSIQKVRFPLFSGANYSSIDLPTYTPSKKELQNITIKTPKNTIIPPRLLYTDLLAYKTLQDRFSYEFFEAILRATSKAIIAKQSQNNLGDLGGLLASIFLDITSSSFDSDYSNWSMLANSGYISNLELADNQTLEIIADGYSKKVTINNNMIIFVNKVSHNTRIDYVTY